MKNAAGLMAISLVATGMVTVLNGQAAFAGQSCKAHWELDVITDYGTVFKPTWTAPLYDNKTSIVQGPFSYTTTTTATIDSTASSGLHITIGNDISSLSADLGISLSTQKTGESGVTNNFSAPAHTTLHVQYGIVQYHTYDEHYYVTTTCQITNATFGDSYSDWQAQWKAWTTAAT
jgi:hypothetical protein